MRMLNCSLDEAINRFSGKRIVFFGAGSWLKSVIYTPFVTLKESFKYIVDNTATGQFSCNDVSLDIYPPEKVREEDKCIIILTSPVYMYDMYCQLEDMNLPDEIECFAFPFMQMISDKDINQDLLQHVLGSDNPVIPKIIHSFWFSGDEKPEDYQKCIDTWSEHLGDYNIIEWNQTNYDCSKHPFLKKAIQERAWAFASDYARLDVLREYGGIYLDMDVEVFQPFDCLLGNEMILSYSNNIQVDLAVMGSRKNHPLLDKLLKIYDECMIPQSKEEFATCFQPSMVKPILYQQGIRMDGSLQKIEGATVFPREFFMPQDHVLFFPYDRKTHTFCNHLDNFGWSFIGKNKREKKIEDNRKLWELLGDK